MIDRSRFRLFGSRKDLDWRDGRLCAKNFADPRCIRGDPAPCMTGGGKKFVGKCCGYY